jgi:hypothetical protein
MLYNKHYTCFNYKKFYMQCIKQHDTLNLTYSCGLVHNAGQLEAKATPSASHNRVFWKDGVTTTKTKYMLYQQQYTCCY